MRAIPLKNRMLFSMFAVIAALSVSIAILGIYVIKADIMDRAQRKVRDNLKAAQSFYLSEIEKIETAFNLVSFDKDITELRSRMNLHYLQSVNAIDIQTVPSEIVKEAFQSRKGVGGTRLMTCAELSQIDPSLVETTRIQIKQTPMALPTDKKQLDEVMVKEYALPVLDNNGQTVKIYYGGRIINCDYELVDKIRQLVFGSEQYHSKPVGTVTIFQDDTRISTNVPDETGQRAIGTRVSAQVYKEVVEKGNVWDDRAFVVNTWYKTAYEPVKNINGKIIGIIYVGTIAEPFDAMTRHITFAFIAIVAAATAFALILSIVLAGGVSRPLTQILKATEKLSSGQHDYVVCEKTGIVEVDNLAQAFNDMSAKLNQREQSLKIINQKLEEANKNYIDLIGFVSHELKGILASTVLNAYGVRDGFLGMVNFKQLKALDSITRNLDYLDATVKKFLNLGRIEKGELDVNKTELNLKKDIFDISVDSLKAVADRKKIKVDNKIDKDLCLNADHDLMLVAANNLISNAIKYGNENSTVLIKADVNDNGVEVEIYNDSTPISDQQKERLFKKFSRLDNDETKKVKGTGLGLFITKQIIEKHGGQIRVEPKPAGNSFIFTLERVKQGVKAN